MLRSTKQMIGYRLDALDGEMGKVKDLYFDDHEWAIRYVVADTRTWLPGRKILLSPACIGEPNWNSHMVPVSLTKDKIEQSPSIEADRPVSRQYEKDLAGYYGWPMYWSPAVGAGASSVGMMPVTPPPAPMGVVEASGEAQGDPHLRSIHEIFGYHIHATDGEIGHVDDVIVQTDDWSIRYLVVDTGNWLPGRRVLMSPFWIDRISWPREEIRVEMSREAVKNSPLYDPSTPVNREYEARLYDYYGVPRYWDKPV